MSHLMAERREIALRILKGLEGWHLHVIGRGGIVSLIPAVADVGPGVGEKAVGRLDTLHRVGLRGGDGIEMRREALDLLDVELRIAILLLCGLQFVLTEHSQRYA